MISLFISPEVEASIDLYAFIIAVIILLILSFIKHLQWRNRDVERKRRLSAMGDWIHPNHLDPGPYMPPSEKVVEMAQSPASSSASSERADGERSGIQARDHECDPERKGV